jgi:hypothetical protein
LLNTIRENKKQAGVSISKFFDVAARKHLRNLKGKRNLMPF